MTRNRAIASFIGLVLALTLAAFFLRPQTDDAPAPVPLATPELGVSGKVVDGAGLPISGAAVSVRTGSSAGKSVTTNADGSFFVPAGPGDVELDVRAPGFVTTGIPHKPLWRGQIEQGAPVLGLLLTLHQSATLQGNIVAGRAAVSAHLTVLYRADDGDYSIEGGVSEATDGRFTISNLAPGRIRLLAEADGFALAQSPELVLADGESRELVLDMDPGGSIQGTVTDAQGNPLAAADIVLQPDDGRVRRIHAGSDGSFLFTAVPSGSADVRATAPGFGEAIIEGIVVVPGEVTNADLVMEASSGVFGRIFDVNGPVSQAFIYINGQRQVAAAQPNGTFQLAEGARQITVVSPSHVAKDATVIPGIGAEIELTRGGSVQGSVVDSEGRPAPGSKVSVNWFDVDGSAPYNNSIFPEVNVSADGSFQVGPLRPGMYTLVAQGNSGAVGESSQILVQQGNVVRNVRIALPGQAAISGMVRDEQGHPIPQARVELFEAFAKFSMPSAVTGPDGRYRIEGAAIGRRSLRISARGFVSQIASGIDVHRGDNIRDMTLKRGKQGKAFTFGGIGAILGQTEDGVIIRKTMDGKPAATYGLQENDLIRAVDGQNIAGTRLDRVIEMLRGEEGADVDVDVERDGKRMTIKVTRGTVEVN